MNSENSENFFHGEVFDNWDLMSNDEKTKFLTNPSAETIEALTKFLKEFNKTNERVTDLRESRHDSLIELLMKGDRPIDEIQIIVDMIDKGIKEAEEVKDKDKTQTMKALVIVGGITSIVAGGFVTAKNKKAGIAMIATGSAALLGLGGSETKMGKSLLAAFSDMQDEEAVEV